MNDDKTSSYLTRDAILKLLSDKEVTRVSNAETAARLIPGDEYLDLERFGEGVRKAHASTTPMGRVLPRKAVLAPTWNKIIALLKKQQAAATNAAHENS